MTLQEILHQILTSGLEINIIVKRHANAPAPRARRHMVSCEFCGWTGEYDSPQSAARALRSHHNHCAMKNSPMVNDLETNDSDDDEDRSWLQSMSSSSDQAGTTTDED